MAILNYTTEIDALKSIGEVSAILVRNGAKKISTDYDDQGNPVGVTFCLIFDGRLIGYCLPCNYAGVLRAMANDKKIPRSKCTEAQAIRVSWRIIKDWVEAQMAIVQANVAVIEEVFLPYALTKNGNTVYKEIKANASQFLLEG